MRCRVAPRSRQVGVAVTLMYSLRGEEFMVAEGQRVIEEVACKNFTRRVQIGIPTFGQIKKPGKKPSPGDESPGDESPGDESPGDELPGVESPGDEFPGVESLGDKDAARQAEGLRENYFKSVAAVRNTLQGRETALNGGQLSYVRHLALQRYLGVDVCCEADSEDRGERLLKDVHYDIYCAYYDFFEDTKRPRRFRFGKAERSPLQKYERNDFQFYCISEAKNIYLTFFGDNQGEMQKQTCTFHLGKCECRESCFKVTHGSKGHLNMRSTEEPLRLKEHTRFSEDAPRAYYVLYCTRPDERHIYFQGVLSCECVAYADGSRLYYDNGSGTVCILEVPNHKWALVCSRWPHGKLDEPNQAYNLGARLRLFTAYLKEALPSSKGWYEQFVRQVDKYVIDTHDMGAELTAFLTSNASVKDKAKRMFGRCQLTNELARIVMEGTSRNQVIDDLWKCVDRAITEKQLEVTDVEWRLRMTAKSYYEWKPLKDYPAVKPSQESTAQQLTAQGANAQDLTAKPSQESKAQQLTAQGANAQHGTPSTTVSGRSGSWRRWTRRRPLTAKPSQESAAQQLTAQGANAQDLTAKPSQESTAQQLTAQGANAQHLTAKQLDPQQLTAIQLDAGTRWHRAREQVLFDVAQYLMQHLGEHHLLQKLPDLAPFDADQGLHQLLPACLASNILVTKQKTSGLLGEGTMATDGVDLHQFSVAVYSRGGMRNPTHLYYLLSRDDDYLGVMLAQRLVPDPELQLIYVLNGSEVVGVIKTDFFRPKLAWSEPDSTDEEIERLRLQHRSREIVVHVWNDGTLPDHVWSWVQDTSLWSKDQDAEYHGWLPLLHQGVDYLNKLLALKAKEGAAFSFEREYRKATRDELEALTVTLACRPLAAVPKPMLEWLTPQGKAFAGEEYFVPNLLGYNLWLLLEARRLHKAALVGKIQQRATQLHTEALPVQSCAANPATLPLPSKPISEQQATNPAQSNTMPRDGHNDVPNDPPPVLYDVPVEPPRDYRGVPRAFPSAKRRGTDNLSSFYETEDGLRSLSHFADEGPVQIRRPSGRQAESLSTAKVKPVPLPRRQQVVMSVPHVAVTPAAGQPQSVPARQQQAVTSRELQESATPLAGEKRGTPPVPPARSLNTRLTRNRGAVIASIPPNDAAAQTMLKEGQVRPSMVDEIALEPVNKLTTTTFPRARRATGQEQSELELERWLAELSAGKNSLSPPSVKPFQSSQGTLSSGETPTSQMDGTTRARGVNGAAGSSSLRSDKRRGHEDAYLQKAEVSADQIIAELNDWLKTL